MKAIYLTKDPEFRAQVADVDEQALPEGDVVVRIEHSTINYKDALAIANASPIVRLWPMVPGIDFAGVVESSTHPMWKPGDSVILNGWGVGESHWGGLAQKASVKGDWLVRSPAGMTSRLAMAIGTAGYTAMLCVMALERAGTRSWPGPSTHGSTPARSTSSPSRDPSSGSTTTPRARSRAGLPGPGGACIRASSRSVRSWA